MSSVLDATRKWLREQCPLIDKNNKFNANYLGASGTEYALTTAGDAHAYDICGYETAAYNFVFSARVPYGTAVKQNLAAAEVFEELGRWIRTQNRKRNYPEVSPLRVTSITMANSGMITQADANTANDQIQIKMTLEE